MSTDPSLSSNIKENLKLKYLHKNSRIFSHGRSYFFAAKILEESLVDHPNNIYPILTLWGLSIELFLKGIDVIDSSEKYEKDGFIFSNQSQTETNIKGSHNLKKLFLNISQIDPDLYQYFVYEFSQQYNNDLVALLEINKDIFPDSRYAYENVQKQKCLTEFDNIRNLSNFLYEAFDKLINDVVHH